MLKSSDYYKIKKTDNGVTEINIDYENMPALYRYFPVSDYSVENFVKGEVWGTTPNKFNDPYDSIACYTTSKIKKAIREKINQNNREYISSYYGVNSIADLIEKIFKDTALTFNNQLRSQWGVACFSINYDSDIMWGHYAKNGSGFVLKYSPQELFQCALSANKVTVELAKQINPFNIDFDNFTEDNLTTLIPIMYTNAKHNCDAAILNVIDEIFNYMEALMGGADVNVAINEMAQRSMKRYYSDIEKSNTMMYSLLCKKNICWRYENEWRVWVHNYNAFIGRIDSPYVKIGNVNAEAIYLGEFISDYNKRVLLDIAEEKGIPAYQMKTVIRKNSCKLNAIKLN